MYLKYENLTVSIGTCKYCSGVNKVYYVPIWQHIHINSTTYLAIECAGGIEKSVPRITNWHHEDSRVMTNGNHEGRVNPITVYSHGFLLNCTTVGQASDSMTALIGGLVWQGSNLCHDRFVLCSLH